MGKEQKTKFRRTLACLMAVLMLLMAVPFGGFAAEDRTIVEQGNCGETVYNDYGQLIFVSDDVKYTLYSDGELVISGSGEIGSFHFHQEHDFAYTDAPYIVRAYNSNTGAPAVMNRIVSVVIQNGVTGIGDLAFGYCYELESVTIADTVTRIGCRAFYYCNNLTSVKFSENTKNIEFDAFSICESLEDITIPDSVEYIGKNAFSGTAWYRNQPVGSVYAGKNYYKYKGNGTVQENVKIDIKEGTKGISQEAFYSFNGLTSVTIPDSVTNIGKDAFFDCDDLTSVTIPDSVTNIAINAFRDCDNLSSVTISDSVTNISSGTFYDCISLTSVTIPDSVTNIDDYAFKNCRGLTSIIIPDSVTSIGRESFDECENMKSLYIGKNVKSIGKNAFYGCTNLTKIEWNAENANDFIDENGQNYDVFLTAGINGSGIEVIFGNSVKKIPAYMFERDDLSKEHANIKTIAFGNSVTNIGEHAFDYCKYLTSITLPDSVTNVGDSAFSNCINLVYAESKGGLKTVGDYVFKNCRNLSYLIVPNSVTTLGDYGINGCDQLKDIYYGGTEEEFNAISFGEGYADRTDITVHFNFSGCLHRNTTEVAQQDATCTEDGYTAGEYCEDCGEWISGHELIAAHHTDENGDGICDICGKERTVVRSGNCGKMIYDDNDHLVGFEDNVTYKLYDDGQLVISGSGEMGNFYWSEDTDLPSAPYAEYSRDENRNIVENSIRSVVVQDGVTAVGYQAFAYCTSLINVDIAGSVRTIGRSAFSCCEKMQTVELRNGVETIKDDAFWNNMSLKELTLPESINNLERGFIWDCRALENINVSEDNRYYMSENGVVFNKDKTTLVRFPCASKITDYEIPFGVTSIETEAFQCCWDLNSVTVPDGVTEIKTSAFINCSSLAKITVNNPDCTMVNCAIPRNTVIYGYSYSTAYDYALENGNEFVSLDEPKELESISISAMPTKTVYKTGTSFNRDGLTITLYFADGTSHEKTQGFTVSGFDSANAGTCTLTVTYAGKTATFDVKIVESLEYIIRAGETITVDIEAQYDTYVKFVPEATGTYTFYSSSNDDTYASLCNANKAIVTSDDDSGESLNFSITASLEKGTTYYYAVRFLDSDTSGSFDVTLVCDELECEHANTTEHAEQPASCTEDGCTAGVYCEDCGKWISGHEVIKKHHTDNDNDGICDICGEDATKFVIKTGNCGEEIYDDNENIIGFKDNVTYTLYDNGELVISGSGPMGNFYFWNNNEKAPYGEYIYDDDMGYDDGADLTVKKVILEDGVTSVGNYAFMWFAALEEISLPDSVTSIGHSAFVYCGKLKSIAIPDSVTSIGRNAFDVCTGLTEITLPSGLETISEYAFSNCYHLETVNVSTCTATLSCNVFNSCFALAEINVDPDNTVYESENGILFTKGKTELVMYPCGRQETEYTVPDGVERIADSAFYCSKLQKVTLPDSVTVIADAAFSSCISLENIRLSENLSCIGENAFLYCTSLKSVVIPASLKSVGYWTFGCCEALESVTLPETFEEIGTAAFSGCISLKEISIPESVSYIGNRAFDECSSLAKITVYNPDCDLYEDCIPTNTVIYGYHLSTAYDYAMENGNEFVSLGEIVNDVIASGNCGKRDENGNFGENVKWSLYRDGKLVISGSGEMADFDWTQDNLPEAPYASYSRTENGSIVENTITSVVVQDGVTTVGYQAFAYCTSLMNVDIAGSVKTIRENAFANSTNVETVEIRNGVETIEYWAFANNHSLKEISLPESIKNLDYGFIWDCRALENIHVNENNSSYMSENGVVFTKDKTSLVRFPCASTITDYEVPAGVTSLEQEAFQCCRGLVSIIIPDSVSEIKTSAFINCNRLSDVYYTGTKAQWDDIAIGEFNEDLLNATIHFNFIPPHDHDYVGTVTAPTCTTDGFTTHTCSICGDTYTDSAVPALGHSFTSYVSDNNATCTADGTKTAKCDRCDVTQTVTDNGSKLSHTESGWITDKAPDCTHSGSKHTVCTVCGLTVQTAQIPATGHSFVQKTVEPTCDKDGRIVNVCSVCKAEETVEVIPATGHKDADNDGKCDDCGESVTPSDPSANCSHICHKGGFAGFIWKLICIFLKLFRINPVCSCGAAHY